MNTTAWRPEAKTATTFAVIALLVGVLRYFAKDWTVSLGLRPITGSFIASVTIVLIAGTVWLFSDQARRLTGSYARAALWYLGLAAWCECVVVAGILVTGWRRADTYYRGPWHTVEERFPTALAHAMGHFQGFLPRTAIGLFLGTFVYWAVRRARRRAG